MLVLFIYHTMLRYAHIHTLCYTIYFVHAMLYCTIRYLINSILYYTISTLCHTILYYIYTLLGFAVVPDVTWSDVGALSEIREELLHHVLGAGYILFIYATAVYTTFVYMQLCVHCLYYSII